jgi:cytochrome P450
MGILSWAFRRLPFGARLIARFAGPIALTHGKPLERWLMVTTLPSRKLALANDPAIVETVMIDRAGQFPKSTILHDLLAPLIGDGVFGQPGGTAVKATRRLYARALATIADETVRAVSDRLTRDYVERWLTAGRRIDAAEEFSRLTVDIVSECTLGRRFTADESQSFARLFFDYHKRATPLALMLSRGDAEARRQVVRDMALDGIGQAMRALMRGRFVEPVMAGEPDAMAAPFVRTLAEAGRLEAGEASAEGLLDEIAVMLLAGHETTASTLAWLSLELAGRRPMQDDVAAALAGGEPASWPGASAPEMLDALSREALRLYPPIAFFLRDTTADAEFRLKPVPAGSFFVVAPWTLQRHRRLWKKPDDFAPQRWLSGEAPARTSYMPFGMGARACPGARFATVELEAILGRVLSQVTIAPAGRGRPRPLGNLTSRPDRPVMLTVTRRG